MDKESVAVVKCNNYNQKNVDNAVEESLRLIGFSFKPKMKVLIKPNIIGSYPKNQDAITTHPSVIKAVCKILKKNKCKIYIGDSPFMNSALSFKNSGIEKIADEYGEMVIFEKQSMIRVYDKHAKILKNFMLAKLVKDVDLIIDMPKLKTHMLTKYTGAVKNLYGCLPGGVKQRIHKKAKGDEKFSKVLVDIYQNIKPELTIMDAVIGMEGEGPTSGIPKKTGYILSSKNAIALDIAASEMIGLKKGEINVINEAIRRKLYPSYDFKLLGIKKLPNLKFKIPNTEKKAQNMMNKMFIEKPIIVDKLKCTKCGTCAKNCPAGAISLIPFPSFDKKKCIRCFCCIEICPNHAISV
jgi:uncharacterized protein (DUF362 family)